MCRAIDFLPDLPQGSEIIFFVQKFSALEINGLENKIIFEKWFIAHFYLHSQYLGISCIHSSEMSHLRVILKTLP